ncbi:ion channel [Acidobacteriota bacterium]
MTNDNESKINKGLKIVDEAKELEKNKTYDMAAKKYKEARELFKEIGQSKLYAQCLVAFAMNMIKYYHSVRDIEGLSEDVALFYVDKIEVALNKADLKKIDKYDVLINAYSELGKIFESVNMVYEKNEAYFKKTSLYHKYFWNRVKQKGRNLKSKIRDFSNFFSRLYFHLFCGHGERPLRIFAWIILTNLLFSSIFKLFNLIEFTDPAKPLCFWQSFYFSVVTFTTLGYGDIVPKGPTGQLFISIEVFIGYFMLGTLIAFFYNKMTK